jgi:hypothetical protein
MVKVQAIHQLLAIGGPQYANGINHDGNTPLQELRSAQLRGQEFMRAMLGGGIC